MGHGQIVKTLLHSKEPSIRWKVRAEVLKENPTSSAILKLQEEVRTSSRARALITQCRVANERESGLTVYAKWQGAHWVLASLADMGFPAAAPELRPFAETVYRTWLDPKFYEEFVAVRKSESYRRDGVPIIRGRYRRCASQQGNALRFLDRLGLSDERSDRLVERLLHWRWPDGGWNCDKEPSADSSSFMETRHAMIGLARYGRDHHREDAVTAARGASEVFLRRHLYRRESDRRVIHPEFVALHHPLYWHYDFLAGLQAMAAVGTIQDPRCEDALDLLESKRLEDGGWPSERCYYKVRSNRVALGIDWVDWGGRSAHRYNEWVTVNALSVLADSGRLNV